MRVRLGKHLRTATRLVDSRMIVRMSGELPKELNDEEREAMYRALMPDLKREFEENAER